MEKLLGGAKLYQLPLGSRVQMMSYALEFEDKLFIIDGGTRAEADFTEKFLQKYKKVDGWFLTHAHADHIECVTEIIARGKIKIDRIYFNFENLEEVYEEEYRREKSLAAKVASENLFKELKSENGKNIEIITPKKGDLFNFGQIKFMALTEPQLNISRCKTGDPVNNLGVVYKIFTPRESILILGDLAEDGGKILMKDFEREISGCAVVQMAHHGQRGVNEEFYRKLSPKVCLWPAPDWLWDNLGDNGFDTGPHLTVRTREWMQNMGITRHIVEKDGFQILE